MDRIYDNAKDKNVAKVVIYAADDGFIYTDAALTRKLTSSELEDAFLKGCVVIVTKSLDDGSIQKYDALFVPIMESTSLDDSDPSALIFYGVLAIDHIDTQPIVLQMLLSAPNSDSQSGYRPQKIYDDAKDKNVAKIVIYTKEEEITVDGKREIRLCAYADSALTRKLTASELKDAFLKGCVIKYDTSWDNDFTEISPIEYYGCTDEGWGSHLIFAECDILSFNKPKLHVLYSIPDPT